MVVLDRILLGIIALVLLFLSGMLVTTLLGNNLVLHWLDSANLFFDGSVLALILLLLAVYLVILVSRFEKKKYIVYPRELGNVRISSDCVESLIVEAARQMPGIHKIVAEITDVDEPKVSLKIQVNPDFNIPQLSEQLQDKVKNYVENTVGVTIQEVEIFVVAITKKHDPELDLD